ncbi:MAG: cupin domain-containing protein [Hungatella sp.]|jgi:putative monooxygenase|nr:cupin domain-containing protein [Hungatella sp.]
MEKTQIIDTTQLPVETKRGGRMKVYASPKTVGCTQLVLGNTILQPGESTIEHLHDYSEEVLYILKGRGAVLLEGVKHNVQEGTVILAKKGQRHKIINEGREEMELIFASAPLAPSPETGHRDV